jgi:acylphosphatase
VASGRVQGVFFRDSLRREAASARVAGWVTNRDDGKVEAVFEGDEDDVERVVDFVRRGPGHAQVDQLDVIEEQPEGLDGFRVR